MAISRSPPKSKSPAGWIAGELRLGRNCIIHSRATARKSAFLDVGVQALSVFAAEITTAAGAMDASRYAASSPDRLQFPPPANADRSALSRMGLDLSKLSPLGPECWIYAGSLRPEVPVHLTAQLVVRGDCSIPVSSLLEQDLKASGNLYVGAGSECKGNVVSEKSIGLGLAFILPESFTLMERFCSATACRARPPRGRLRWMPDRGCMSSKESPFAESLRAESECG